MLTADTDSDTSTTSGTGKVPHTYVTSRLHADPASAAALLDSALLFAIKDGHLGSFLVALREAVKAQGMSAVARDAGVSLEQLHRVLSEHDNPELRIIFAILKALRLRLAVAPLTAEEEAYVRAG